MKATFDKLKIRELINLYEQLLVKLKDYQCDSLDYSIIESKLNNIERIIQSKKPGYFAQKEHLSESFSDNYEVASVAEIFNVSRQTIHNWISQRKMRSIKIGRKLFVSKSEIERVFEHGFDKI